MNEIRDVVLSIVKGCGQGGVEVSEILAAFVARTVMLFVHLLCLIISLYFQTSRLWKVM